MRSSRTSERWTKMVALSVLIGATMAGGGSADAAIAQDTLLAPTPLVLKDGRIANVSIHVLPFDRGDGELAGDAAATLAQLTAQVATDCFLTAQVIGHVSSREVADNETLAAHRLARSRADAVQSSLIGGGLPAKSIASVWDWQFLVREPRATLWVFRLIEGEDCEGAPLDPGSAQLVAEAAEPAQPIATEPPAAEAPVSEAAATEVPATEAPATEAETVTAASEPVSAPAAQAQSAPPATSVPAAAAAEVAEEEVATVAETTPAVDGDAAASEESPEFPEALIAEAAAADLPTADQQLANGQRDATGAANGQQAPLGNDPAQEVAGSAPASVAPQDPPEQVAMQAGPAGDAVPTVTRPIPALSPAEPDNAASVEEQAGTTVAAIAPGTVTDGAGSTTGAAKAAIDQDPERQGKVEWGQDGDIVITFATNSSYFPPGTTRRLGTMLENASGDQSYRVQLRVGVSGTDKVVGASTPEEARRYNQWLAERRMTRVREWLVEHAQDRQLEIEPEFLADDSSRRVLVRIAPVS